MKKTLQCPKCESLRIGNIESLPDEIEGTDLPRHVGETISREEGFFGTSTIHRQGAVEAFICTDCGFFEEYVKEPTKVPWDDMETFRWCRPEQPEKGPFR